jgi:hypothetical protein
MATRTARNGNLEQAMTLLIQNQAAFIADMRENAKQLIEIRRELEEIKSYLIRHEKLLAQLPEAIREKIGFKA